MIVINDTHCGAIRSGGTTQTSAYELRQATLLGFRNLVKQVGDGQDFCVAGDLFDTFNVALADLLEVYRICHEHFPRLGQVFFMAGNHDLSKSSTVMSSFQLLCQLLEDHPNFHAVFELTRYTDKAGIDFTLIPHLANQDLFDAALKQVDECDYLIVHCNYDNGFAAVSDHSLNLSKAQATECKAKNIIFAHEHHYRVELGGTVVVIGNQLATSVSDWLGSERKYFADLGDIVALVPWADRDINYTELDWRNLREVPEKFIRVIGSAVASEAADVATAISKYRAKSNAFVITNAVKIGTSTSAGELEVSLDQIKSFKLVDALKAFLTPEEWDSIQAACAARNVFGGTEA